MRRPRQRVVRWLPAGDRRRAAALAGVAAAGAGGILALLRWKLWSAGVPTPPAAPLRDWFDPAALARNRDYREGVWTMAAIGVPLGAGTAIAVAALGGRWRPLLVRAARARPWRAGAMFGGGLALATFAVGVPLAIASYAWGRHWGIVTQPVGGWAADQGKGLGIQVAIAALVGTGATVAIARLPRLWWLALAGAVAGLIYAGSLLSPIIFEPLFQKTHPLRDPALSAQILDIARRAGVQADDVVVNDASTRTTAANAYVSGLGGSRHIVLYDTLLRDFPEDQVRFVVAHELSHVERQHVLKGSTWGAALAVPGCLLVFAIVGWRTGFGPAGRDAEGCRLVVRRVAIAAASAITIATLSAPLQNWVSRAYEREADWRGLELVGDPAADIGLQKGFVARSLGVPNPPEAVQLWFGTHPTPLERIALALRFQKGR